MIISLTGFMGCGKSSVGRRLSELLCCRFVDLDEYIVEKAGRTIPEIFASEGESAFRQMESDALRDIIINASGTDDTMEQSLPSEMSSSLCGQRGSTVPTSCHKPNMILSLGGGAVMTKECAELVKEKTCCIYLRTSVETLVERLENESERRPLLASGQPLRTRIETLMAKREATYEATAHHIVDTDGLSIDTLARTIISLLYRTTI